MKILIVRLSAIGDIVMASPLVQAVRRRYPDAWIAWLAQPEVAELLSANPSLDEVLVWPRNRWRLLWKERRWLQLFREIRQFRKRLVAQGFDLVVDVQGLLKSGILAWLSGAPQRVGLGSKEGSAWLMSRVIDKPADDPRIGSEYLHVARELGWMTEPFEMDIALSEGDRLFARQFIERTGLDRGYAVFAPFTTRPQKHWVEERWAELAGRIHQEHGLPAVVLGGPNDRKAFQQLAEQFESPVYGVIGESSLRQSAAIIGQAELVVGVDTGLTHMGIASRVATVALFGATRPYLETGVANARVIYKRYACSPCRRQPTCGGEFFCMKDISVEEVMKNVGALLRP